MGSFKDNILVQNQKRHLNELAAPQLRAKTGEIVRFQKVLQKQFFRISNAKTLLPVLLATIYYAANYVKWFQHPTDSLISDLRMAIFGLYLFIVYMGALLLPEPKKIRPHVFFWRLVQGHGLAYICVLTFLVFMSQENLQLVFRTIFDSSLGVPLPEQSYAEDCRVYTPENPVSSFANITGSIDMFVAAHFFGWTVKMWIFRDNTMAWTASILFEIFEWTMEVWLENFKECWWDHLLLDTFGCNLIGMLIGLATMRLFKMRSYNWFFESTPEYESLSLWGKAKYYFSSREEFVRKGRWHWLGSMQSFNSVLWFLFGVVSFLDLSYFFNKTNLNLQPSHWLLAVRLSVVAPLSILGSGDYFDYISKRKFSSMGSNVFMMHVLIILELVLWFKHLSFEKIFKERVHLHMQLVWVAITLFIVGCYVFIVVDRETKKGKPLPRRESAKEAKKIKQ